VGQVSCRASRVSLPWTLLVAAALARARTARCACARRRSHSVTAGTPWRFALCAFLPFLILLSLAATARDVYAAPAMLGFALLVALWANALRRGARALMSACLALTRSWSRSSPACSPVLLAILAAAERQLEHRHRRPCVALASCRLRSWRCASPRRCSAQRVCRQHRRNLRGLRLAFTLTGLLVLPVIDRWQDLGALARRSSATPSGGELAVLDPDETTIAMLDHRSRMPSPRSPAAPG
jgi:hypothetical protein